MLLPILTFVGFAFSSSDVPIHSNSGRGEGLAEIVHPTPAPSDGDDDTPQRGTAHHVSSNLEGKVFFLLRWGSGVLH